MVNQVSMPPAPSVPQKPLEPIPPVGEETPTIGPKLGFFQKNLKRLLVVVGIVVIVGLLLVLWPRLSVVPEPSDAEVSLGNVSKESGAIWVLPYKSYTLKVEKDGFVPYEKEIKLGFGKSIKTFPKLNPVPLPRLLATAVKGELSLGPGGKSVNYLGADGQTIFRVLLETPIKEFQAPFPLNLNPYSEIQKLIFSSDQNIVVILGKNEVGVLDLRRRDVTSQTYVSLGGGISDLELGGDDKTIYYFYSDPKTGEKSLIKDNIQKTDPDRIFDQSKLPPSLLKEPKLELSPTGNHLLLLSERAFLIDLRARGGKVLSQENPKTALFSTQGSRLILFSAEGEPWVYKISGELEQKLPFKTSGSRFVFQDENRALAVTDNRLLGYNFETKEEISYTTGDIKPPEIEEIILDKEGKELFIKANNNLYQIALTQAVSGETK